MIVLTSIDTGLNGLTKWFSDQVCSFQNGLYQVPRLFKLSAIKGRRCKTPCGNPYIVIPINSSIQYEPVYRPAIRQNSLVLTGSQSCLRDFDLTVGLVGLEGWSCTQLSREGLRTLGACGAGAGTITTIMRILLFINCYQLVRKGKCCVSLVDTLLPL